MLETASYYNLRLSYCCWPSLLELRLTPIRLRPLALPANSVDPAKSALKRTQLQTRARLQLLVINSSRDHLSSQRRIWGLDDMKSVTDTVYLRCAMCCAPFEVLCASENFSYIFFLRLAISSPSTARNLCAG